MQRQTVILGLSGGVDSLVSAILLQKQGYEVIGVHFLTSDNKQASLKTQKIAKALKIKLILLQSADLFQEIVIEPFLKAYQQGLTPNPCVFCNRIFKFQLLLDAKKQFGADFIATGHYVRKEGDRLFRGKDKNKDQGFFLARLRQQELASAIFPLGDLTKEEVKKIAKESGFKDIAESEGESQDLCFIEGETVDFLREKLPAKYKEKGQFIKFETQEVVGEHESIFAYTIGQRAKLGGQKNPLFVKKIDPNKNIVYLSEEDGLYNNEMELMDLSFLSQAELPAEVLVQVRHRAKAEEAKIELLPANKAKVHFKKPVRAITPGQSVAIYAGDELLGGGVIKK